MPEYRLLRFRGKWAVGIYDNTGRRLQRLTLSTTDKREAERRLANFQREHARPKNTTLAHLWQAYLDDNAAKRIAVNMSFSGKAVLPFFGHLFPDEVTADKCRTYIAARKKLGRKPGTIWTELNHLQIVLNAASNSRAIPIRIVIEKPPKPAPRDRRLTKPEGKRLLDAAQQPHIKLAIALMLGTGARTGAILGLTWNRVDFGRGLIVYSEPDEMGRRKGRATVPMGADLRTRLQAAKEAAISDYVIEWGGKAVKSLKTGFGTAVDAAGLVDVTPHVLRHTAATWMAEQGVPMTEIAAVLGHSSSRTTELIYAKYTPAYLARAISALDMSEVLSGSAAPVAENET